jgi:hypothetical protein
LKLRFPGAPINTSLVNSAEWTYYYPIDGDYYGGSWTDITDDISFILVNEEIPGDGIFIKRGNFHSDLIIDVLDMKPHHLLQIYAQIHRLEYEVNKNTFRNLPEPSS